MRASATLPRRVVKVSDGQPSRVSTPAELLVRIEPPRVGLVQIAQRIPSIRVRDAFVRNQFPVLQRQEAVIEKPADTTRVVPRERELRGDIPDGRPLVKTLDRALQLALCVQRQALPAR